MFVWAQVPAAVLLVLLAELLFMSRQPAARRARMAPSLLAGTGLVLAWMCTHTTVPQWAVLVPLAGALVAHGVDLRRRW